MAEGIFKRLMNSLSKSRNSLSANLDNVFSGASEIDEDFYEELEERMIMADIGVVATSRLMDRLREQVAQEKIRYTTDCRELLIEDIKIKGKRSRKNYRHKILCQFHDNRGSKNVTKKSHA